MSCILFLLNGQVTAAEVEAAEALSPLSPGKCPPVSSLPSFPVFVVLSAASSIVKLLPSDGFLLLTTTTATTTTWTASLSIILPFTVSVCFTLQSGAFIDGFLVVVVVVMVMAAFSLLAVLARHRHQPSRAPAGSVCGPCSTSSTDCIANELATSTFRAIIHYWSRQRAFVLSFYCPLLFLCYLVVLELEQSLLLRAECNCTRIAF